mmetsp:Transcript_9756/g.14640  ORF Transcript_9756/g.14640 Transcript_9756/m.14640 type:complete len:784 (+) Transcript_9756:28-2379(+)|eukprot:CAMPEP_0167770388 /NCGR_PEP_ID=MMETSP0110_2-20121227/17904_1 /TAXON_ID=629695 /ORGANISM="Gymnochlora sp., Strain CCMP2014" /LENGTH=783 /DNA_ID=CAMNT_0007659585 /DNA_START=61 /DNA_END=2412 /DNA_ORIENTATION=+
MTEDKISTDSVAKVKIEERKTNGAVKKENGMKTEEKSKPNGGSNGKEGAEDGESSDDSSDSDDVPLRDMVKGFNKSKKSSRKSQDMEVDEDDADDFEDEEDDSDNDDDDDDDDDYADDEPIRRKRVRKRRRVARDDDEEDFVGSSRKRKARSTSSPRKRSKATKSVSITSSVHLHKMDEFETRKHVPLTESAKVNRWWTDLKEGSYKQKTQKWSTLEHNGVVFPPPYEPHGIKMKYDGKEVDLTPEQEEVATFFAVLIETQHGKNKVFQKNFFNDWKKLLGRGHVIKDFKKCDFRPIFEWSKERKELMKAERKKNKEKIKLEKERLLNIYGFALVDGFREKVGNYRVEPPGLFRGRGEHPRAGKLKFRVMPEQITLNIGKGVKIPECPVPGHKWKGVIHNQNVTWLAYWIDNINGDYKYVWLAGSSKFKGMNDFLKYEKSRALKGKIDGIRATYRRMLTYRNVDKDLQRKERELGTATFLIDALALRVGNEKDTDKTADTVGCCSLRVEHLTFKEDQQIHFHFLGKDSIKYDNTHYIKSVDAYNNLKDFCKGRPAEENVFQKIEPSDLNQFLREQMEGLSAKVFRTYNASITLQQEFDKLKDEVDEETNIPQKEVFYNQCNRKVAELCNHQRTEVLKSHGNQMEKMKAKLKESKRKEKLLREHIRNLKSGKNVKKEKVKKEKAKKEGKKEEEKEKVYKFSNSLDVCERNLGKLLRSIDRQKSKMTLKEDNKTVSLNTSKINYMDPRITVAWCKRNSMPIEKVFNASLLSKFPWAMEVPSSWRY